MRMITAAFLSMIAPSAFATSAPPVILSVPDAFTITADGHLSLAFGVTPAAAANSLPITVKNCDAYIVWGLSWQKPMWNVDFFADGTYRVLGNVFTSPDEKAFLDAIGIKIKCE